MDIWRERVFKLKIFGLTGYIGDVNISNYELIGALKRHVIKLLHIFTVPQCIRMINNKKMLDDDEETILETLESDKIQIIVRPYTEDDLGEELAYAAKKGDLEYCRALLEKNPYVDNWDDDGKSALYYACTSRNEKMIDLLLENNANINETSEPSVLEEAVSKGDEEMVTFLLDIGADPSFFSEFNPYGENETPLYNSLSKGFVNIARILIDRGADIKDFSRFARYFMLKACRNGDKEMVLFLLENGVDPNCMEWEESKTHHIVNLFLLIARENNHYDIDNILMVGGARYYIYLDFE